MESRNYSNYDFAKLPDEELKSISDLEKALSSKMKKDVVLIAYQHTEKDES